MSEDNLGPTNSNSIWAEILGFWADPGLRLCQKTTKSDPNPISDKSAIRWPTAQCMKVWAWCSILAHDLDLGTTQSWAEVKIGWTGHEDGRRAFTKYVGSEENLVMWLVRWIWFFFPFFSLRCNALGGPGLCPDSKAGPPLNCLRDVSSHHCRCWMSSFVCTCILPLPVAIVFRSILTSGALGQNHYSIKVKDKQQR